jgi:[acyl-carrier-protein] S-malonyltransferase
MQPAVAGMRQVIAKLDFAEPNIPVIANTTARAVTAGPLIKDELIGQLDHCVRWQDSVQYMLDCGVGSFIEIGPGKVLTGLIKRIDKSARAVAIGDSSSVIAFAG